MNPSIVAHPYFHPLKEPMIYVEGNHLSIEEAKRWVLEKYGPRARAWTHNMTSFTDKCDVFIISEIDYEDEDEPTKLP